MSIYVFLLVSLVLCLKKLSVPVTSLMMLGSRMQSHLQLRVQILKGAAPSVFEYMLSILPPELPGTCHRKSTPTLHRFGRTLAQGFYVDVHVGHPRRIRKLGWENPGHGPKGLSGIQYRHPYSKYPYSKSTLTVNRRLGTDLTVRILYL